MTDNTKIGIRIGLFVAWLVLSFSAVYYLIAGEYHIASWRFASTAFMWYLLVIIPVSITGVFLILRSYILDTIQRIRIIVAITGLLLVIGFTLIQWTETTTAYWRYDNPNVKVLAYTLETPESMTPFERDTLYREGLEARYSLMLTKLAIFNFTVSLALALVLIILKHMEHQSTTASAKGDSSMYIE